MAKKAPKREISQPKEKTGDSQNLVRDKFCWRRTIQKHWQAARQKISNFSWRKTAEYGRRLWQKIRTYPYKQKLKNLRWRNIKQWPIWQKIRRLSQLISDSWKTVLFCLLTFFGVYYLLGSQISEKIDIKTKYNPTLQTTTESQTAGCLAFLIRRETDEKMWTPNLPLLFPASILDNMPNFQIGIISAARDVSAALKQLQNINETQKQDLKKAHQLLTYSPYVWLLSKKGSFGLAPSANAQYRKAAKSLQKFNVRQEFVPAQADLSRILALFSRKLRKITAQTEDYQREHADDWFDFKADDIFYYNRGYAFALWQIGRALGIDYKETILAADTYADWTFLISSLRQAAEFGPLIVRNGSLQSITAPNHLSTQNYYLMRALATTEKIRHVLEESGVNADADKN